MYACTHILTLHAAIHTVNKATKVKCKPPQRLRRIWAWRGTFEAHIPGRDRSWQGYWVPPPHPHSSYCPLKPTREEGPPLLTCQLQRACLLLPQSFDTKIVQEASVSKMPQQTFIQRIEGGKRKKGSRKRESTRELQLHCERIQERTFIVLYN